MPCNSLQSLAPISSQMRMLRTSSALAYKRAAAPELASLSASLARAIMRCLRQRGSSSSEGNFTQYKSSWIKKLRSSTEVRYLLIESELGIYSQLSWPRNLWNCTCWTRSKRATCGRYLSMSTPGYQQLREKSETSSKTTTQLPWRVGLEKRLRWTLTILQMSF